MKTVCVIGASGTIGTELLQFLRDRPLRVRAGTRNTAARRKAGERISWTHFDFQQPDGFPSFFDEADALFFLAPHKDPVPSVRKMLEAAKEAGIEEVVFSSGRTTGDVVGRPLHRIEAMLPEFPFRWTVLRPGWFMQNFADFLDPLDHGFEIALPVGDARTAFVDVRDIAAVAARLLVEGVKHRSILELTSAESLHHDEVARMIGAEIGREIHYRPVSEKAFLSRAIKEWGWPEEMAEETAYLYRFVAKGKEAEISEDVARFLDRPPLRFARFATDYREHWKSKMRGK